MKQLVIVGAGGFGREVLEWARESVGFGNEYTVTGFLDDKPDVLEPFTGIDVPVLGNTVDYVPQPGQVFVIAIGHPAIRKVLWKRFVEKGAEFATIIHNSCIIGSRVQLGNGVILCPRVVLTCDIRIGDNTALNVSTAVGHDAVIGSHCQLSSFCDITGYVKIGDCVMMGSRANVIPGKSVGSDSVVGAGSVVVANVPDKVTVFGNPARILTRHG
jgi:sugar O-acyltransferase (sialic acid O-acetyltransferase NeuD family)